MSIAWPAPPDHARTAKSPTHRLQAAARSLSGHIPFLLLLALVAVFLAWSLNHLAGFEWDTDEGINVMKGRLVQLGYPLYVEVWADQPPGFPALVAVAFNLLGPSVEAARAVVVAHACLALLAVAWIVLELDGNWAGALAATAVLAVAPNFFWISRAAMIGLPSLSLAMLAMAAALRYSNSGRRPWLVLAALFLSAALLEKLVALPVLPPIVLLILLRPDWARPRVALRGTGVALSLFAAAIAAVFLATCLLVDARAMILQVAGTYLGGRQAYPLDLAFNLDRLWRYLILDNRGLLVIATFGVLVLAARRSRLSFVVLTWLGVTVLSIVTQTPLWTRHHFLPLLLLMAVLSGYGIGRLADSLRSLRIASHAQRAVIIAGLLAVAFYAVDLDWVLQVDRVLVSIAPYNLHRSRSLPAPASFLPEEEAVAYLQDVTRPDDFVLTDRPMIAFRAGRRVPPPLGVLSEKRTATEGTSAASAVAVIQTYKPEVVLLWQQKLDADPTFANWLRHQYSSDREFGADREAWRPRRLNARIQHPLDARLGEEIHLLGYNLLATEVRPGGQVQLMLFWQASGRVPDDYAVFVHLRRDGKIWLQMDGEPVDASYPTTWWMPGEMVLDARIAARPASIPPGRYDVVVGMYDRTTLRRLPAKGCGTGVAPCPEDAILLDTVDFSP